MSTTINTRYEYLQHMTSGECFAVQFDSSETVIASYGPVACVDLGIDPSDWQDWTDEDNEWFDLTNDFRLLSDAERFQIANR